VPKSKSPMSAKRLPLIIFSALTILIVILYWLSQKGDAWSTHFNFSEEFKVGFPYSTSLAEFDPARVEVAGQYALLENLYIPLLLKDNEGRLVPGAAAKFYWVGDEIEFVINDKLVDSGGEKITVDDVYFSLMRLLVLGSSTHGDLRNLICSDKQPQTVDDKCEGLRIVDGKLRVKPARKTLTIFDNFSAIDFSVIPRRSVDPNDLKTIDLSITSGVYYIKERRRDGSLVLAANTKHIFYSDRIPQTAIFVPTRETKKSGLELFESGEIDYLSPLDQTDISERIDRYKHSDKVHIFQTLTVRLELIAFTEKGLQLSSERRWSVGNRLANELAKAYAGRSGFKLAYQYFPEGGKGSISPADLEPVISLRNKPALNNEDGSGIVIGFFPRNYDKMKPLVAKALPGIKVVQMTKLPAYDKNISSSDYPHLYVVSMDTGFLEELPNVINSLKSGFLGTTNDEREKWLSNYLINTDEAERLTALRELHLKSLLSPVIIPIVRTPYVSLVRKPWRPNFSFLFPNSPVWKISRD